MNAPTIEQVCQKVVEDCTNLDGGEFCLLIKDLDTSDLHRGLEAAIRDCGAIPVVLSLPEDVYLKGPLSRRLETAMTSADVVLISTREIFPHALRRRATETGSRLLSMCTVTEEMALRALSVDHDQLSEVNRLVAGLVSQASQVLITSQLGTEIRMQITGQPVTHLDGLAREPGRSTALPAGVVALAPLPETAEGKIMVDGSIHSIGLVREPVALAVKKGRIEAIEGGEEAGEFLAMLEAADENAWCIAEVGLGTNPRATYTGNLVEDERVRGSGHVGFGSNTHLGGTIESALHIDATIKKPSIYLDDTMIVSEGSLTVEH
jgi:leucyl aminopeptidase (aminopeptidase T)